MHVHLDQAFGGISLRPKHQLSRHAGRGTGRSRDDKGKYSRIDGTLKEQAPTDDGRTGGWIRHVRTRTYGIVGVEAEHLKYRLTYPCKSIRWAEAQPDPGKKSTPRIVRVGRTGETGQFAPKSTPN